MRQVSGKDAKIREILDTEDKKISIRVECFACKPFGIATWHTAGAVRDIRVRALTDAEKKPGKPKPDDKD